MTNPEIEKRKKLAIQVLKDTKFEDIDTDAPQVVGNKYYPEFDGCFKVVAEPPEYDSFKKISAPENMTEIGRRLFVMNRKLKEKRKKEGLE